MKKPPKFVIKNRKLGFNPEYLFFMYDTHGIPYSYTMECLNEAINEGIFKPYIVRKKDIIWYHWGDNAEIRMAEFSREGEKL